MDEKQLIRSLADAFVRVGSIQDGEVKVIRVQDRKTTFVEPNDAGGQSIIMNEYKVDGKIYWAGYSSRSRTIYVSLVTP